jgi:hypothetical protein
MVAQGSPKKSTQHDADSRSDHQPQFFRAAPPSPVHRFPPNLPVKPYLDPPRAAFERTAPESLGKKSGIISDSVRNLLCSLFA